jgi:4-amino-4-deoxy-L-arabinose transferase-like glycosyltransferase
MSDTKKTAFAVLILACIVRLLAIMLWSNIDFTHGDPSEYLALAQNIRLHGVFSFGSPHPWGWDGHLNNPGPFVPTAARAPLYPLMIASLWWRETPPVLEVRVLQALLGGIVALLVYLMTLDAFGRKAALIAGIAMALAPLSSYMTAHVMSETLFTFLLTSGLWLWGKQQGLLAGILLGAAILTRAVLLPFVILIALFALVHNFNRTMHAKIVLGAMLVITPWTIRNALTQHALIPVAVQGWGSNLLFATINVPYGSGNPWPLYGADATVRDIVRNTHTESEAESQMIRVSLGRITRAPLHWLWMRTKQYPRLFVDSATYLYPVTPIPPLVTKNAFLVGNFLFLILSIAGVFLARKHWAQVYHLALFPIFLSVVQFPVLTDVRYSLPMVPMLTIFAALTISHFRPNVAVRQVTEQEAAAHSPVFTPIP